MLVLAFRRNELSCDSLFVWVAKLARALRSACLTAAVSKGSVGFALLSGESYSLVAAFLLDCSARPGFPLDCLDFSTFILELAALRLSSLWIAVALPGYPRDRA